MKKKACKTCRMITNEDVCPICKKDNFTNLIKGRVHIMDLEHSKVAKILDVHEKGEYAIRLR